MIIELVDNFYIETDEMNFMLKEKYMGKDKNDKPKEQIRTISYHTNVEHALHRLIEHRTLSDDSKLTLGEYIKKRKEMTDEVTRAFNEVSG